MYRITIIGTLDGQQSAWQFGSHFIPRKGEELEITHKGKVHKVTITNVCYSVNYEEKTTENSTITITF